MDKIAIISDIHGNLPALEGVLADIQARGIERVFCLGDIAGKGPSSAEALDLIRKHCEAVVKGNWDFFLTEQENPEILLWHQNALGVERLQYLRELPIYLEFYMSGKWIRLCHASPNDLFHRVYANSDKVKRLRLFEATETHPHPSDVVGYGDIHGAFIDHFDGLTLFNVGSVGNPLELTQASYGIIEGDFGAAEPSAFAITLVRVPYDIEMAIAHANATDMPEKDDYIKELRTAVYRGRK